MRRFTAEYLRETRDGMWADSREALANLELGTHERVLDVGCGTGELTSVIVEECDCDTSGTPVVGLDADRALLSLARERAPVVQGDALRLPFADGAFDLVVCQALLINLPDPESAIREFVRISSGLVASIEPDNGAVTVESTVGAEERLAARARRAYVSGVDTDVTLGGETTDELFETAGLTDVRTTRYAHEHVVEPPYDDADLAAARKKVSGESLAEDRKTMLAGDLDLDGYDELRTAWRSMGRDVVAQMQASEYRREEMVPFFVTVGEV